MLLYLLISMAAVLEAQPDGPDGARIELTGSTPQITFGNSGATILSYNESVPDTLACSGKIKATDVLIEGTSTTVADLIARVATLETQMTLVLQTTPPSPPPLVWSELDTTDLWCEEGNKNQGYSISNSLEGINDDWSLHDAVNHGWRWCDITVEQCKTGCVAAGGCVDILYTANRCCFPSRAPCTGSHAPGHVGPATAGTYRILTG